MLFEKTGNMLERSEAVSRVLTILIIVLAALTVLVFSGAVRKYRTKINEPVEVTDIDSLERSATFGGPSRGLNLWGNPYPFAEGTGYKERWAVSQWYAQRALEDAYRRTGNEEEADAAAARAEKWKGMAGSHESEIEDIEKTFGYGRLLR